MSDYLPIFIGAFIGAPLGYLLADILVTRAKRSAFWAGFLDGFTFFVLRIYDQFKAWRRKP